MDSENRKVLTMALEHAILVSLAERAGTGYELGRQFSSSIGHFWSATHQQIYRTLGRLAEDGLVDCESVAQDGRPDKKVYSLSASGREALREWVVTPTPIQSLRDDLGVKIRAAEHADLPRLIAEIAEHRELHRARRELFDSFAAEQFPAGTARAGRKLHQYLVLRGGIGVETFFIDWCTEVIDALEDERRSAEIDADPESTSPPIAHL